MPPPAPADAPAATQLAQFARIAAATTVVVGAIAGAGVAVVRYVRSGEFNDLANAGTDWRTRLSIGAAVGVLLGMAAVAAKLATKWRCEATDGMRRQGFIGGMVVGLVVAVAVQAGVVSVVQHVENHTPAAAAARAHVQRFLTNYRKSPVVGRPVGTPAPAALGAKLISAHQLGNAWYSTTGPRGRAAASTPAIAAKGITESAFAILAQYHRIGSGWIDDRTMIEHVDVYSTTAKARAADNPLTMCACANDGTTQQEIARIHGVRVTELVSGTADVAPATWVSFRVGTSVFGLRYSDHTTPGETGVPAATMNPTQIIRRAVALATASSRS
jgi:hypothetical protein